MKHLREDDERCTGFTPTLCGNLIHFRSLQKKTD